MIKGKNSVFLAHIHRISGQVNGIDKMISEDEDRIKVVGQIMAAKSSLEQLAVRLVKEESKICNKTRMDRLMDLIFKIN